MILESTRIQPRTERQLQAEERTGDHRASICLCLGAAMTLEKRDYMTRNLNTYQRMAFHLNTLSLTAFVMKYILSHS